MIENHSTTRPELYSHLMRRVGVGCTLNELEKISKISYESLVDQILSPENPDSFQEDDFDRYFAHEGIDIWAGRWLYRIINGSHPLREKISIFWHQLFATAWFKSEHPNSLIHQLEMFRAVGLSDMKNILLSLSKDPAMLFWLDNNDNIDGEPNENYGRELMELFSMGVGNYTENDVKNAALAFTGWTFTQPIPLYPTGHYASNFKYEDFRHNQDFKKFLGHSGNFNGEDVIDIIVHQPATANFICRHIYNFFVEDEAQVPAWNIVAPKNPEAIKDLTDSYHKSNGNITEILRTLFNSDWFKNSKFQHLKSPAELVGHTLKISGNLREIKPGILDYVSAITNMGQHLLNPPTVEGWHTGKEWIDGGTLNERINFAVSEMNDPNKPGIKEIINQIKYSKDKITSEYLIDLCIELVGQSNITSKTKNDLVEYSKQFEGENLKNHLDETIIKLIQIIVSTKEYQFS